MGFSIGCGLVFVSWFITRLGLYYEDKLVSFECGFMSFLGQRGAFSLHFFLVSILFLIFDVEIRLILPLPILFGKIILIREFLIILWFIVMVLGGLYFEWWYGSLEWAY